MAQRKVSFAHGEYYHIYNRGNSKQKIFRDKSDYNRFIDLLFVANASNRFNHFNIRRMNDIFSWDRGKLLVAIGAYTLMPNHFHLLVRVPEHGDVSKFMQKLSTGYSMYFNEKYSRTGSLFEGKFKAQHVADDRYLKYLFSYIHLNALKLLDPTWREHGFAKKTKAVAFLDSYPYSSYGDYAGEKRQHQKILDPDQFPTYFPDQQSLMKELMIWITYAE